MGGNKNLKRTFRSINLPATQYLFKINIFLNPESKYDLIRFVKPLTNSLNVYFHFFVKMSQTMSSRSQ